MRIRNIFDTGSRMEKFGSGIRCKHPGSATLATGVKKYALLSDKLVGTVQRLLKNFVFVANSSAVKPRITTGNSRRNKTKEVN